MTFLIPDAPADDELYNDAIRRATSSAPGRPPSSPEEPRDRARHVRASLVPLYDRAAMVRLLVGVLIGLAIGVPAGAAGWYLYDDENENGAGAEQERERADELAARLIQGCGVCTVTQLVQLDPGAWRMIVEADDERYCFRIELDALEPYNVAGFGDLFEPNTPGVRKTACA
jgi:hypothetical protein